MASLTAQEMITKFENMVDDTLDSDYALQLLMDSIYEIEAQKDFEIRKKEQSFTITAGDDYTNTQALPTDFSNDLFVIEGNDLTYRKISFEDRYQKINGSNSYFLDMANDTIGFAGSNLPGVTVYLYYIESSPDLTVADTWAFPARFHGIIPYQMAEIYYAADAGEKSRAWDDRWSVYRDRALASMFTWDDRLKTKNRVSRTSLNRENGLNLPYA